jgi:hypothetical protein
MMMRSTSENERPTNICIIPSKTVKGPSEEDGSKNRNGSISEMGSPSKMKMSATETEMTIQFRRVSSMTEYGPSEGEVSNMRDGISS